MTVSSLTTKNSYSGDASTTTFAYGFKIFASSEIKVFIRSAAGTETLKTLTTHYTLTNIGNASGGNVVFESGSVPAATETVVLIRDTALTQSLDLVENDPFLSGSFEDSLDKVTHQMIEIQEEVDRSFKVSQTNTITSAEFTDSAATRASKTLGFDSDGNLTTVADFLPKGGDSAQFTYSTTTTDSDPGSGVVRFNNATIGSATIAYIDDLDAAGTDVSAWVQSFDDVSGNDTNRGRIRVSKSNTLDTWHVFKVSAAVVDASGYTKVNLTYIDGAGTLANNDKVFISFVASGEDGSIPGYFYKFDTGTSKADPGAGELSFNNATYANVTKICIDDADSHGVTTQADTATWGSSTSTIKGFLHIVDINDETTYARFKVTDAASDESGFNELTVVHLASNNTFSAADELSVHFSQSGNTGDTGAVGPAGATGIKLTWETATGDSDQGAGKIWGNNATFASISVLYIDDVDANSTNIETWIQTLDDSTNSALRGTIYLEEAGTNSQFGVFSVTGACVDGTGYWKIPVSHVASNVGSLVDGDIVGVVFARTGNAGNDGDGTGDMNDVSDDTSPQLGGNLDMNSKDIITTGNADIDLAPHGTGKVVVKGNTNPGTIVFNCESNSHGQTVKSQPHSATVTNTLTLPPGGDGELVSTVATQTLTNKSIVATQLTGTVANARLDQQLQDVAGLAVTDGNIIVGDGSNFVAENGATARASLGLALGSDVQAYNAGTKIAGVETIWIPSVAMYPNSTNGCAGIEQVELSNGPEIKVLDFDASSDENAQFAIAMPKSWNEGTVTFQAYFTVTGTNTGTVAWGLSGVSLSDNDSINTAFGTNVVATAKAHSGTSNDLNVTAESGAVTIAGTPAVGDQCYFQIMRDVSADDQSGDARLLGIKLFFTTNAANDA